MSEFRQIGEVHRLGRWCNDRIFFPWQVRCMFLMVSGYKNMFYMPRRAGMTFLRTQLKESTAVRDHANEVTLFRNQEDQEEMRLKLLKTRSPHSYAESPWKIIEIDSFPTEES